MNDNIKVQIKYIALIRDKTGRRQEEVSFPQGTILKDVIEWLNDYYTLNLPNSQVMGILNGRGWEQLPSKLSTEIKGGDVILLLPPICGG